MSGKEEAGIMIRKETCIFTFYGEKFVVFQTKDLRLKKKRERERLSYKIREEISQMTVLFWVDVI